MFTTTPPPLTVATYAGRWLARRARASAGSRQKYAIYLRHVPTGVLSLPLADVRPIHMRAVVDALRERGLAGGTQYAIVWALKSLFADAIDDELLGANPVTNRVRALLPRRRKGEPVAPEDRDRLLEVLRADRTGMGPLFRLLYKTGLRLGEALALEWERVDLPRAQAHIAATWNDTHLGPTKSRRARTIDLPRAAVALVESLPRTDRWLWQSPGRGKPWTRRGAEQHFAAILATAGLPARYTPHGLRHTFAVEMIEAGAPLEWLQQQLGHASVVLTRDLYGRFARVPRPDRALETWAARMRRHEPLPLLCRVVEEDGKVRPLVRSTSA